VNLRTERAISNIIGVREDANGDWQPHHWTTFELSVDVLVEEVGRIDRRNERKPAPKARKASDWEKARQKVMRRSGGACEVQADGCGVRAVHVHHRLMRSQGGGDEPANLLAACRSCHNHVHDHPAEAYDAGWLLHAVVGGPVRERDE
jgi:hypothetical protein